MNFQVWLNLIKQAGVDPTIADVGWLDAQFRTGTSPAIVANWIKLDDPASNGILLRPGYYVLPST